MDDKKSKETNPKTAQMPPFICRHIAVIGAGPAGLVAARELRREGHVVVVFEKQNQVGGTWVYTEKVDSDPLGIDPGRVAVHSSVYSSLRTNLPREVMGFKDYPFVPRSDGSGDPRRFPGHREVLMYLKEFAREFGVEEMVRFEAEVVNVGLMDNNKWRVKSKKRGNDDVTVEEIFDAVVVCNGIFFEPVVADIRGGNVWPGKQLHSHNYRIPEPFKDQVVVLIGNSFSGFDISRDIAGVVKEVHIASKYVADETYEKLAGYDNMWLHSTIESAHEDGSVIFKNGRVVFADVILHCTGYTYNFPFLETNGAVTVDDNRVALLYKHVFPAGLAPWLSFVGIPWKVVAFPLFESQSKWIAGVLSGRILLPSEEEMLDDIEVSQSGIPKRRTHDLNDSQFEYNNWVAAQCGCPGFEEWRKQMTILCRKNRIIRPQTYRDEWDDHDLVLEANQDYTDLRSN